MSHIIGKRGKNYQMALTSSVNVLNDKKWAFLKRNDNVIIIISDPIFVR